MAAIRDTHNLAVFVLHRFVRCAGESTSPFRDPIYRWIARNRYRWFGKRDTCRVPTAEERERIQE